MQNGKLAFFGKGEVNDIFPKNVKNVELFGSMQLKRALSYSDKLLSAVIGEDVSKIDSLSFNNCKNLSRVEISESVSEIGIEKFAFGLDAGAFRNCAIDELSHPCLTIENGIAIRDGRALYRTNHAENIIVPDGRYSNQI